MKKVPIPLNLPFAGDMRPTLIQRDAVLANAINSVVDNFAGAVFTLTSDTNLRISVKGSDGTTRHVDLTLAP